MFCETSAQNSAAERGTKQRDELNTYAKYALDIGTSLAVMFHSATGNGEDVVCWLFLAPANAAHSSDMFLVCDPLVIAEPPQQGIGAHFTGAAVEHVPDCIA
eukprot:3010088-Amphidinium_carterae.1